jgi:hypothetical protein
MTPFVELVERVCTHPGMYVQSGTYAEVAALITGYDLACNGGALLGFREWLVVRLGGGANLSWPQLALSAAFPDVTRSKSGLSSDEQQTALTALLALVREYADKREREGMRRIYLEHQRWLEKQEWYGPDSPDWLEAEVDDDTR